MAKKDEKQLMFKIVDGQAKIVPQKGKKKVDQDFVVKNSVEPKAVKKNKVKNWFRLDNAATIYPSSKNEHWTFVFRISAVLKQKVDAFVLQKSLNEIMPRFPTFDVYLKKGFFWYYFEHSTSEIKIEKELEFPCSFMDLADSKKHLIRVLYSEYRISLEVFHAITDGRGATIFLNSLLARYFENLGYAISSCDSVLRYLDLPKEEEMEDSFFANASSKKGNSHKEQVAYNIRGTIEDEGIVNTTNGVMSVKEVKEIAKKHNANLTTFLAGCLCYTILKKRKNSKKPVKISIPIDLRTRFCSKTLRNFSSYINIAISDQSLGLDEVINQIKSELEKVDNEYLEKNINANVSVQNNWFIKIMPLCVKNFFLNTAFNVLGEKLQTFAFSNIGAIKVPQEFNDLIERYEVNLGRSKHNSIAVGLISFNDCLVLTISSKLSENTTERDFFKFLASLGVTVKVESNRRDEYGG